MNNIEYQNRAAEFAKLTVKHQKQNDALRDATFLLTMCENVDFVLIAGPTGAGKSHLLERLQNEVSRSEGRVDRVFAVGNVAEGHFQAFTA